MNKVALSMKLNLWYLCITIIKITKNAYERLSFNSQSKQKANIFFFCKVGVRNSSINHQYLLTHAKKNIIVSTQQLRFETQQIKNNSLKASKWKTESIFGQIMKSQCLFVTYMNNEYRSNQNRKIKWQSFLNSAI